nr:hypothetical protein [Ardenticatenales bacterium]
MKSVQMQLALFLGTILLLGGAFAGGWATFAVLEELHINVPLPLPGGRSIETSAPIVVETQEDTELALFWEAMDLLDKNFYAQEELP